MTSTQLLNKAQTLQKIRRIAYEIYEQNFREEGVVFAGVFDKGYQFAKILMKEFGAISDIPCDLVKVSLDKSAPLQSEIELDKDVSILEGKIIILIDDVLNTGRTLAYSLKPFLNVEIKGLQTAVIVDRGHKSFPISADYVGYSLSTTLMEHIEVELKDKAKLGVYLS